MFYALSIAFDQGPFCTFRVGDLPGKPGLNNKSIEEVCVKIQPLFVMTIALLCAACTSPPEQLNLLSQDFENYQVILIPSLAEKRLDVYSEAQGWEKDGKNKGWVGFAPGKSGTITFTLNALPLKPVCTADEATTAEWVISKVELTKNGNPQTQKGHNFGSEQRGWIERAFPQMDPETGKIEGGGIGTIAVVVQDLNNDRGKQTGYYQVTARRCSDDLELVTDPGFSNGGRR